MSRQEVWVCTECGERYSGDLPGVSFWEGARWRWNGSIYEHSHEYPLGHVPAIMETDHLRARVAELEAALENSEENERCLAEDPVWDQRDAMRPVVEAAVAYYRACCSESCSAHAVEALRAALIDIVDDYLAAQEEVDGE